MEDEFVKRVGGGSGAGEYIDEEDMEDDEDDSDRGESCGDEDATKNDEIGGEGQKKKRKQRGSGGTSTDSR